MLHCEHLFGYVESDFFDLFVYVFHEGVAQPSANHHDGKDWYPSKYIAIADPDWMECILTSCFWILSFVSPKATTPSLSTVSIILLVMWVSLSDIHTADTGVAGVVIL